jgi:uncharacterized membrane protein YhaH (DUF805 family)
MSHAPLRERFPAPDRMDEALPGWRDWLWLFGSFRGRLDRVAYRWALCLMLALLGLVSHLTFDGAPEGPPPAALIEVFIGTPFSLPILFGIAALAVKRIHDIGWPTWAALILLVPLANLAFVIVLLSGRDGEVGANRYGADPLAPPRDPPRFTVHRGGRG